VIRSLSLQEVNERIFKKPAVHWILENDVFFWPQAEEQLLVVNVRSCCIVAVPLSFKYGSCYPVAAD
jgi:kynurenine formamidase